MIVLAAGSGHVDVFSYLLLELAFLILIAILGRWAAGRFKQPSVLGELVAGVIFGNVGFWLGIPGFVLIMNLGDFGQVITEALQANVGIGELAARLKESGELNPILADLLSGPDSKKMILMAIGASIFSNFGVLLLMFMVGLGTSVSEMKAVGGRATLVALVGVVASIAAGYAGARVALSSEPHSVHLFLGVILAATSVGISARVFQGLGRDQDREAKIVFGASVIDDVASIVALAVVVGVVTTGRVDLPTVGTTLAFAVLFLGAVVLLGERIVRRVVARVEFLDRSKAKLLVPFVLLFVFAWLASLLQLAAITGAFAAGLVISDDLFHDKSEVTIERVMRPIEDLFAPVFFVLMGMQVNLRALADPTTLAVAAAMTVAAVLGKVVAGWSAGSRYDRLTVAMGMIPRGEEALLFAGIGISLGALSGGLFSAIVLMVILTALLAPLGLKWSLTRNRDSGPVGGDAD